MNRGLLTHGSGRWEIQNEEASISHGTCVLLSHTTVERVKKGQEGETPFYIPFSRDNDIIHKRKVIMVYPSLKGPTSARLHCRFNIYIIFKYIFVFIYYIYICILNAMFAPSLWS